MDLQLPHLSPIETVASFNAAWAAGDIDAALAFIAEDAVYELHISNELLPFGGVTSGHDAIAATMRKMRADYEYILFRPMPLTAQGDTVHFQVEFMYRHRASGEMIEGRFRLVMQVRDGQIVRAEEYHDRARIETFLRLIGKSQGD